MALRDLLLHLGGSEQSDAQLRYAIDLARLHEAHLTGLYVVPPLSPPAVPTEAVGYICAADFQALLEKWREQLLSAGGRAEDQFQEQLRRDGVKGEFRIAEGLIAETVARHARCADLIIVGQTDPDHPAESTGEGIAQQALFSSGRPVLVIPYAGKFERIDNSVLVGWNGTREAARAINDAIPLLKRVHSVTVLAVNPRQDITGSDEVSLHDIACHLARHGIPATVAHAVADEISVGDAILNYCSDIGADLLVMGGYGHSRVREIMLGGVTQLLLRSMTLPVLISH